MPARRLGVGRTRRSASVDSGVPVSIRSAGWLSTMHCKNVGSIPSPCSYFVAQEVTVPVNARLRSVVRHQRSARRDQFAITPHSVYPCLVIVSRAPLGDARKQRITQAFRSVVRHQRSARQDQVPLCRYMPKIKRLSPVVGSTSFSFVETWCSFPTFLSSFVHWCSFPALFRVCGYFC